MISESMNTKNSAIYCSILEQHSDWYLVYKPEGVAMHRGGENVAILDQLREQGLGEKLYLVHRLDTPTSGLMLIARNAKAAASLGALFEQHQIRKQYIAIAKGKPKKKQGLIAGDMEKSRRGSFRLLRSQDTPAITRFKSYALDQGLRLYLLWPQTGKTHQLRVACKSLSVPILGDLRYGDASAQEDRMYLHAHALAFHWMGQDYHFSVKPQSGSYFNGDQVSDLLEKPEFQL